jgi:hypothetical protein
LQVQSYHISTMTASERSALAKGWLGGVAEPGTSPIDRQSPTPAGGAQQAGDDDANNSGSNHSSDNEQRDVLETVSAATCCDVCPAGHISPAGQRISCAHFGCDL